ncbi:MAG TPA: amidohydrolase family protein [Bryobacteraceae bacterium]|jgi:N-acetylglucosamine-6-phosphate deacetylase
MKCKGRDVFSGRTIDLEFDRAILSVTAGPAKSREPVYITPGFIDLQVNGCAGVDYNSAKTAVEEIGRSIRGLYSTGVSRLLPTVITGAPEEMLGALRNLAKAKEALAEGASIEGFHVEGPHISPEDGPRGAHPARWVRAPDLNEFRRWQEATNGGVRLVTLSPEWPEATRYIEHITSKGVVASIGHTKATQAQVQDAIRAGATLSTHLGNGAHATLPRHPNYLWEQLAEDRLSASFIVDGMHLPDSFLRVAVRAKGIGRSVLVTDAVAPAMCEPGAYRLGEVEIELRPDGRVTMRGGERLAGSSLRMDHAIGNVMRMAGVSLGEAVDMATRNPARVGRISGRDRGLEVGDRADLVRFTIEDKRLRVLETFVSGRCVYSCTDASSGPSAG